MQLSRAFDCLKTLSDKGFTPLGAAHSLRRMMCNFDGVHGVEIWEKPWLVSN
jgi:hypothetical protein